MKKTYSNPTMDVVRLHTSVQMMAGSPNGTDNGLDPNEPSKDPSEIDGRFGDLDDEF